MRGGGGTYGRLGLGQPGEVSRRGLTVEVAEWLEGRGWSQPSLTNDHRCGGLKQYMLILLQFWVWAGLLPPEAPRKNPFPLSSF